jgi:hypothetical protein
MDFVPHPVQHLDGVHLSQKLDRNNCLSVCRVVLVGNRSGMVAAPSRSWVKLEGQRYAMMLLASVDSQVLLDGMDY